MKSLLVAHFSDTFPFAISSPQLRVDAMDQGKMVNLLGQLSLQDLCSPFPGRAFTKNGQDDDDDVDDDR